MTFGDEREKLTSRRREGKAARAVPSGPPKQARGERYGGWSS